MEKIHKKTVVVRLPRGETTMIAYAEQGSGKRVCIFLHGLFGSKRSLAKSKVNPSYKFKNLDPLKNANHRLNHSGARTAYRTHRSYDR